MTTDTDRDELLTRLETLELRAHGIEVADDETAEDRPLAVIDWDEARALTAALNDVFGK